MKRAAAILGVVVAVLVIVVGGLLFWGSWVSPSERHAMNDALDRIDEVAVYGGSDTGVYEQKIRAAQAAIVVCERKAFTSYDKQLEPLLAMQLKGARAEHLARLRARTDPKFDRMLAVVSDSNRQGEAMLRSHLK